MTEPRTETEWFNYIESLFDHPAYLDRDKLFMAIKSIKQQAVGEYIERIRNRFAELENHKGPKP